jgi:DNA primase
MKDWITGMLSVDAKNLLEQATQAYQEQIEMAGPYLAARGITKEAALTHRLGYVAQPLVGHEQYQGRLAIPFLTPTSVVDIRFLSLHADDSPKYLSRAGAEDHLYNVRAFEVDSDVIAICEGEIDTIVMHSMVGIPAVGLSGANKWKNWYARAFMDYRSVLVLSDGDQAGKDLGKKIAQQIDVANVIHMPDGMDINDVFLAEGRAGVLKRIGL